MTVANPIPQLITPGVIARDCGASLSRVVRILNTRAHIRPRARAGIVRLYDKAAVAMVRHELNAIDAKRSAREVLHAAH